MPGSVIFTLARNRLCVYQFAQQKTCTLMLEQDSAELLLAGTAVCITATPSLIINLRLVFT